MDTAQAQLDANAFQMWLINSSYALQSMPPFPQVQNPLLPYIMGQSAAGLNQTKDKTTKTRKRKRSEKFNTNTTNNKTDAVCGHSEDLIDNKPSIIKDESDKASDNGESKNPSGAQSAETISAMEGVSLESLHPAFQQGYAMSGLSEMVSRNSCKLCGKPFRSSQLLRQHMLVHTDQRKYACQYCDRTFKQLSHLQQHHRIHTGEKPYKCQIEGCNRSFPQLSNLQHHYRNHDKPEPPSDRKCIFCDRTYCSEVVLRNHVLKMHLSKKNGMLTNQTAMGTDVDDMNSIATELSDSFAEVDGLDSKKELCVSHTPKKANKDTPNAEYDTFQVDKYVALAYQDYFKDGDSVSRDRKSSASDISYSNGIAGSVINYCDKPDTQAYSNNKDIDEINTTGDNIPDLEMAYNYTLDDIKSDSSRGGAATMDKVNNDWYQKIMTNMRAYNKTLQMSNKAVSSKNTLRLPLSIHGDGQNDKFASNNNNEYNNKTDKSCEATSDKLDEQIYQETETMSNKPVSNERVKLECASIEDSDQTARPRSLIRVYHGASMNNQGFKASSAGKLDTDSNDIIEASSSHMRMSEPSDGSNGRARKRKAFIPQRILVNGTL